MRPATIASMEVDGLKPARLLVVALLTFVLTVSASVAVAASRVALVVGNGTYAHRPPPAAGFGVTVARAAQDPSAVEAALGLDRPTRRLIQQGLRNEGFDAGTPDGLFGPRTRAAIRAWQAAREQAETGYLDGVQAAALRAAASPPAAVASDPEAGTDQVAGSPGASEPQVATAAPPPAANGLAGTGAVRGTIWVALLPASNKTPYVNQGGSEQRMAGARTHFTFPARRANMTHERERRTASCPQRQPNELDRELPSPADVKRRWWTAAILPMVLVILGFPTPVTAQQDEGVPVSGLYIVTAYNGRDVDFEGRLEIRVEPETNGLTGSALFVGVGVTHEQYTLKGVDEQCEGYVVLSLEMKRLAEPNSPAVKFRGLLVGEFLRGHWSFNPAIGSYLEGTFQARRLVADDDQNDLTIIPGEEFEEIESLDTVPRPQEDPPEDGL